MVSRKDKLTAMDMAIKAAKSYTEQGMYPYRASDYFQIKKNSGSDFTLYCREKLSDNKIIERFKKFDCLKGVELRN